MRRAVVEGLLGDIAQGALIDAVLMQVAPDFECEIGSGHHHAGLAVPAADAVTRRRRSECSACMVVVTNDDSDIATLGDQAIACGHQCNATCGAAVLHSDKRQARKTHARNHVVGLGLAVGATDREIDVIPGDAAVRECLAHRLLGELLILAVKAAELGHAAADDVDLVIDIRTTHQMASNP